MLRLELMDVILYKNVLNYFDISYATEKIGEELLYANAFMEPIDVFIQHRTSKAVTSDWVATKIENQLKSQTHHADAKRATQKLETTCRPYRFSTEL